MDFDLVVRGDIVTSARTIADGYLAVRNGKVAAVTHQRPGHARQEIDVRGAWVVPGVIDAQVHSRSQAGAGGFPCSTQAAAAGGVTTIVDMPYDEGFLVCNGGAVAAKAADVAREAHVDVALHGTVRPEDGTRHVAEQVAAGVCAFKLSTFGTDSKRFPRIEPGLMRDVFATVAPFGLAVGVHNENHEVVMRDLERVQASGVTNYTAHGLSHTAFAELIATAEIYEIGAHTGCRAHVVHSSLSRGVEICETYRRQGFSASIEVCVHYLLFNEDDDVRRFGGLAKINPPIRPSPERENLWRHLAAGNIDLVSTDHVAWSIDRKNKPDMLANASGGPSLDVILPVLLNACRSRRLPLHLAARVLSANPARHFCLGASKGALDIGVDADFAIVDPTLAPYRNDKSPGGAGWSLYEGMELPQVKTTFLRGQIVWDGTSVVVAPGSGRFVRPPTASRSS